MRPPRVISHTTLREAFQTRRRRLDADLVVAVVRALGADRAEADRWRAACLRIHRDAKTGGRAGVLRRLPGDLATFTGRDRDLALLLEAAEQGTGPLIVTAIEGMAGVGKTQLAVHAAHRLVRSGHYTDLQLFTNLRGFDADYEPADPATVLDIFLRELGVPAAQIPATLEERAAMFRDRMHGRRALVLLDNAADEDQVRPLLPGSDRCLVLITSRRSLAGLDGARPHRLDVFTPQEALALLSRVIGAQRVQAEAPAARAVVDAVGCLPLAVALLAARLRSHPERPLADMVRRLEAEPLIGVRGRGPALRPVFDLSFQALPEGAQDALGAIGVHPGRDYTAAAIAALVGSTVEQAEEELERLQDEHLVRETSPRRYDVHDLVRDYAAEVAADLLPDRGEAFGRLVAWYLQTAVNAAKELNTFLLPEIADVPGLHPLEFDARDAAIAWYDAETVNLRAIHQAVVAAGLFDACWQLPVALRDFMHLRYRPEDNFSFHRRAADALRNSEDKKSRALMLLGISTPGRRLGRYDDAKAALIEAARLYDELDDVGGRIMVLGEQAAMHHAHGRSEVAASLWRQVIGLSEPISDRRSVMIAHLNLGDILTRLGRFDEAWAEGRLALDEAEALDDRRAKCIITGNLGEVLLHRGDYEATLTWFARLTALAQETGDRYEMVNSLEQRAVALEHLGRLDEARQMWQEAAAVLDEVDTARAEKARRRLALISPEAGTKQADD
ncbi:tetratricopeptide repeat protein [Catenulispora yoronensis]